MTGRFFFVVYEIVNLHKHREKTVVIENECAHPFFSAIPGVLVENKKEGVLAFFEGHSVEYSIEENGCNDYANGNCQR